MTIILSKVQKSVKFSIKFWYFVSLFLIMHLPLWSASEELMTQQGFYKDASAKASLEEIRQKQFSPLLSTNFGLGHFAIWTHYGVENIGFQPRHVVLYNPRPGVDYLDVYIIRSDKTIQSYHLGHLNPIENRAIYSRFSAFPLDLAPGEHLDLYIKHQNLHGLVDTQWIVSDYDKFISFSFGDTILWGLLIGTFSILIIYNISAYFAIRRKELIFYNLFVLCSLLGQLALSGILYTCDLGIDGEVLSRSDLAFHASLVFAVAFNGAFFELQHSRRFLILHRMAYALLGVSFLFLFPFAYDANGAVIRLTMMIDWLVIMTYLIIVGIIMAKKGAVGGWYYVAGQSVVFGSSLLPILSFIGTMDTVAIAIYSVPIGMCIDAIFLALALNARLRSIYKENLNKERLMCFLSRFETTRGVLGTILAQWQKPLETLNATIEDLKTHNDNEQQLFAFLHQNLPTMNTQLGHMRTIVKEFYNFYQHDENQSQFKILEEIHSVLGSLSRDFPTVVQQHTYHCDPTRTLTTYKSSFHYVLYVLSYFLLVRSLEHHCEYATITYNVSFSQDTITLHLSDQHGFFDPLFAQKLFDLPDLQSQEQPTMTSCIIAAILVKERLHGQIKAIPNEDGLCFEIVLPYQIT